MLHLTLSFLGEVKEDGLAAAIRTLDALEMVGRQVPSFRPARLGFFPERGTPRVFVLLDDLPSPGLKSLHRDLCSALAAESRAAALPPLDADWPDADHEGSRPRRPFKPHLTLARLRGEGSPRPFGEKTLASAAELLSEAPNLTLDRLLLLESRTLRGGPVYSPLAERRVGGKSEAR